MVVKVWGSEGGWIEEAAMARVFVYVCEVWMVATFVGSEDSSARGHGVGGGGFGKRSLEGTRRLMVGLR